MCSRLSVKAFFLIENCAKTIETMLRVRLLHHVQYTHSRVFPFFLKLKFFSTILLTVPPAYVGFLELLDPFGHANIYIFYIKTPCAAFNIFILFNLIFNERSCVPRPVSRATTPKGFPLCVCIAFLSNRRPERTDL